MTNFKAYLKSDPKLHTKLFQSDSEPEALASAASMLGCAKDDVLLVKERAVKCPKCSYAWKFSGHRQLYATCPQCMRQMKLPAKK